MFYIFIQLHLVNIYLLSIFIHTRHARHSLERISCWLIMYVVCLWRPLVVTAIITQSYSPYGSGLVQRLDVRYHAAFGIPGRSCGSSCLQIIWSKKSAAQSQHHSSFIEERRQSHRSRDLIRSQV